MASNKKVLLCIYAGKKKIGCKLVTPARLRQMNRILEGKSKKKKSR